MRRIRARKDEKVKPGETPAPTSLTGTTQVCVKHVRDHVAVLATDVDGPSLWRQRGRARAASKNDEDDDQA
jgi:hypothetical protein